MRIASVAAALLLGLPATLAAQDVQAEHRRCLSFLKPDGVTPEAAIQACTAVIESGYQGNPALVSVFYMRGMAHHALGDYQASIRDYTRAIRVSQTPPLTAGIHVQRAVSLLELRQYDNAIRDLTIGLDDAELPQPLRTIAHGERGITKLLMVLKGEAGNRRDSFVRDAAADLERAVELSPKNARALYSRGVLKQMQAAGAFGAAPGPDAIKQLRAEADADMTAARRLDPNVPPLLVKAGVVVR